MKYTNCGWYANTIKLRCLGLNMYNLYYMYRTVIRCVYQFSYNRTFSSISQTVFCWIYLTWVSYTAARRRETYKIAFFFRSYVLMYLLHRTDDMSSRSLAVPQNIFTLVARQTPSSIEICINSLFCMWRLLGLK